MARTLVAAPFLILGVAAFALIGVSTVLGLLDFLSGRVAFLDAAVQAVLRGLGLFIVASALTWVAIKIQPSMARG